MYWRQFASHGAADRAQRVADLVGKIKVERATTTQKTTKREGLTDTSQQSYPCAVEIVISPFYRGCLKHTLTQNRPHKMDHANLTDLNGIRMELIELPPESSHGQAMAGP
jgi:hypothetical protein